MSVGLGSACTIYEPAIVLEALCLTAAIVVGLTLYTFHAVRKGVSFQRLGPILFCGELINAPSIPAGRPCLCKACSKSRHDCLHHNSVPQPHLLLLLLTWLRTPPVTGWSASVVHMATLPLYLIVVLG